MIECHRAGQKNSSFSYATILTKPEYLINQIDLIYSKTCLKWPLKKKTKIVFQDRLWLNAGQKYCRMLQREHSAILLTFIKLPFAIKTFVLSCFEWPLKTGFTLLSYSHCRYCAYPDFNSDRMSPSWPQEFLIQLRGHVDETRVS